MEYQCGEWWKISVKPRWINPGLLIPGRCFSTTAFRHGKARFLQNYATKLDAGSNMFRPSCSACWVSITPISSAHGAEKLYQHYVVTYVLTSYLASYLTYILTCLLCDILSDIFSDIHSGIPFDIYSNVLFGMLTDILSDGLLSSSPIWHKTYVPTLYLAFYLQFYLTFWHSDIRFPRELASLVYLSGAGVYVSGLARAGSREALWKSLTWQVRGKLFLYMCLSNCLYVCI